MTYDRALEVVRILFNDGHTVYFAGGWVRDFLLGKKSEEIDIATSCSPERIQELFPKTVLVGVEFGVVVVVWKGQNFEVTTFRKDLIYNDGRRPIGIDFSTAENDAHRRDFTINGMFFDPLTEEIHDYVQGRKDLEEGIIRAIGDPELRFQEDRLRMIRAVRFSSRFGFEIETKTRNAIIEQAHTLFPAVSVERIWQELKKLDFLGDGLVMLHELGLLEQIFPKLKSLSLNDLKEKTSRFNELQKRVPTMLLLSELFEGEEKLEKARYLKVPNSDLKLVEFGLQSEGLFKNGGTLSEWAHFYAHPGADALLELRGFHEEHLKRKSELAPHIERIRNKTYLVNAGDLQREGISPGKKMGDLLKEGVRLSIEENIVDKDKLMEALKKTPLWKD